MATLTIYPSANGRSVTIPHNTQAGLAHWEVVSRATPDWNYRLYVVWADVTYFSDYFRCEIQPQSGTISNVRINAYTYNGAAGTQDLSCTKLYTNGVEWEGTWAARANGYLNVYTDYATNPTTGAQWIWPDVYDMEFGVRMESGASGSTIHLLTMSAIVTYTAYTPKGNIAIGDCGVF